MATESGPQTPNSANGAMRDLRDLVGALAERGRFDHRGGQVEIVETHISLILLTGEFAYKFRKPLDLGFLDFTTLERRRHYCEEELRLNRRLAPDHYLAVVGITGTIAQPVAGGAGPILEYAVKMRRFEKGQELDRVAARGELTPDIIDALAAQVAAFHRRAAVAALDSPFAPAGATAKAALANFAPLSAALQHDPPALRRLAEVENWTRTETRRLAPFFEQRRADGMVRECHGDLHLGNIVLDRGRPLIFDCLEFSGELRWIDVMNEVAFLVMDLGAHALEPLGWRFLNRWLQELGDYPGVAALRYYIVYRALVRAKIAGIRIGQVRGEAVERARRDLAQHLEVAVRHVQQRRPALIITHGLSGSGKSLHSQQLAEELGAVWVRSDVERKRLHGLAAGAPSGSGMGDGIYSEAAGAATYARLLEAARTAVQAGITVIVDAAFLRRGQRRPFQAAAAEWGVPFRILAFCAPAAVLEKRVLRRAAAGSDASEADLEVLRRQHALVEPLEECEQADAVRVDTGGATTALELMTRLGLTG